MFLKQLLLPALLVASINAHPSLRAGPQFCGTPDPTEEQINASKSLLELERSSLRLMAEGKLKVDTYFHIIAASGSEEDGNVTQKKLDDQLAKLADAYAPHGISFNLLNVTRTINASWANLPMMTPGDLYGSSFKKVLRQGNRSTLNVYFVKDVNEPESKGLYGYCLIPGVFPLEPFTPENLHLDGCVIRASTMPGGSQHEWPGNQGGTAVHEVGHWFNLFHPFEGGCEGVGDLIDDTPTQALTPQSHQCVEGIDTCPESDGDDPIHNYMGYSGDEC